MKIQSFLLITLCAVTLSACNTYHPGPDKQAGRMLQESVSGAGAGAVAGFQLGAGTGPGALVGAGVGAVAGGIHGLMEDSVEDQQHQIDLEIDREQERALAHKILNEHYNKRLELHPTRDIFPADLFFNADQIRLRRDAYPLIEEIASLNKNRMPWSRLEVTVYVKTESQEGEESQYARHLSEGRAKELSNQLIKAGIEPRRIVVKAFSVKAPILIDNLDNPARYNQAVEITPIDR